MPKLKTNRGAAKRFKATASGKFKWYISLRILKFNCIFGI